MALRKLTPFLVFGLLTVAGKASAHMIETNYFLDQFSNEQSQQVLKMQSTYSNGQPLKGAKVNIYSPNNPVTPWAQGLTDSEGRFSFSPDQTLPGDWEVVIRQQGHGDILTVPVDEAGVTTELISDRSDTDIHYGSSGLVVSIITLATFGLWRRLRA